MNEPTDCVNCGGIRSYTFQVTGYAPGTWRCFECGITGGPVRSDLESNAVTPPPTGESAPLRALIEKWNERGNDAGYELYVAWAFRECAKELAAALSSSSNKEQK